MGSGDWFKTIISSKKVNNRISKLSKVTSAKPKSNGFKWKTQSKKETSSMVGGSTTDQKVLDISVKDLAATRIQTAYRAYLARKALRRLRGRTRLQILAHNYPIKKQATTTLNYLHSWSKIQAQIRSRRLSMVTEGRRRQKKLENQLKLEAKLHDFEVEWSGGSETMEEVLGRIHLREEAALKRERAMAYAFSHQWRANSSQNLGNYEIGKANWGWSWTERWIAARPWESRVPVQSISPRKVLNKQANKGGKIVTSPTTKTPASTKSSLSNGNRSCTKARRLSYPAAKKEAKPDESTKAKEAGITVEQSVS